MRRWAMVPVVVLLCALMAGLAVAEKGEKADKADKEPKKQRVYAPYHDIGLTGERAQKVAAIQADYRARIEALEEEMHAKIRPELSPEQIAALEKKDAEAEAKRKAYYEKRRAEAEKEKADKGN